jgi:hypothetical protein
VSAHEDDREFEVAMQIRELPKIEEEIDRKAAEIWGLTEQELKEIRVSLAEAEA